MQVVGTTELSFLNSLDIQVANERIRALFAFNFPCLVITRSQSVPLQWLETAKQQSLPVLSSPLPTTKFMAQLTAYLEQKLAPSTLIHGELVDMHGVGILIFGESGIGKSETALELVKRGHRLVADDAVEINRSDEAQLSGQALDTIRYLMEIRGLGILDIRALFGIGSVKIHQNINLIIRLEEWQADKNYDRLGIEEETMAILEVVVPYLTIPVRPGRNLAGIIEVAAMNYRLKLMGKNSAKEFTCWQKNLLNG